MIDIRTKKIDDEFKPAPQFIKLYYIYLTLAILLGILTWLIPVAFFAEFSVTLILSVVILISLLFTAYWIPKYYDSMLYRLTENEIVWRRGVWFKKTGIVPYNRITNIDIIQGPISRRLRMASLKIQTAGYSVSGAGGSAEIRIEGVEKFEELRELIMDFVRGRKPIAVETYGEDSNLKILNELIKIRELIEKGK